MLKRPDLDSPVAIGLNSNKRKKQTICKIGDEEKQKEEEQKQTKKDLALSIYQQVLFTIYQVNSGFDNPKEFHHLDIETKSNLSLHLKLKEFKRIIEIHKIDLENYGINLINIYNSGRGNISDFFTYLLCYANKDTFQLFYELSKMNYLKREESAFKEYKISNPNLTLDFLRLLPNAEITNLGLNGNNILHMLFVSGTSEPFSWNFFLDKKVDINQQNKKGETPICALFSKYRSRLGRESPFEYVNKLLVFALENKADLNICDNKGCNPLQYYCSLNAIDLKTFKTILENTSDINAFDFQGKSALCYLLGNKKYNLLGNKKCYYQALELLLEKKAIINNPKEFDGRVEQTNTLMLLGTGFNPNKKIVKLLVEKKASLLSFIKEKNMTIFENLCSSENFADSNTIKECLCLIYDKEIPESEAYKIFSTQFILESTPKQVKLSEFKHLHNFFSKKEFNSKFLQFLDWFSEIVDILPSQTNSLNIFHLISSNNNITNDVAEYFYLKDKNYFNVKDEALKTVAHLLSENECLEISIFRSYLEFGTDFTCKDSLGKTPLHYLCSNRSRNKELFKFFRTINADFNATDHLNQTPLSAYCSNPAKPKLSALKYFLEKGCNFNHKDSLGNTPLHYICKNVHIKVNILDFFLENHSNFLEKDRNGDTPLHTIARNPALTNKLMKFFKKNAIKCEEINNNGNTPFGVLLKENMQNVNGTILSYFYDIQSKFEETLVTYIFTLSIITLQKSILYSRK